MHIVFSVSVNRFGEDININSPEKRQALELHEDEATSIRLLKIGIRTQRFYRKHSRHDLGETLDRGLKELIGHFPTHIYIAVLIRSPLRQRSPQLRS
jgi:hypothetical protein